MVSTSNGPTLKSEMPNPLMDDVNDWLVGWLFVWLAGLLVIWLVGSCLFGLVWFDHMSANGVHL